MTMYCKSCGKPVKDNTAFCGYCGAPVEVPSQYGRPPAVSSVITPKKKASKIKNKTRFTILLTLFLMATALLAVFPTAKDKIQEDHLSTVTPLPSREPIPGPSIVWEYETAGMTQPVPAPSIYVPETVAPTETPTAPPAPDALTTGVWVLYSPQTTDAESYVFYTDHTVDVFYHSVMDGNGERAYEYSGTYSRFGDQVYISAGGVSIDARFESGADKLWFETYNGPVEITCYMQQYPDFPDYDTLISDGNTFRQSVG